MATRKTSNNLLETAPPAPMAKPAKPAPAVKPAPKAKPAPQARAAEESLFQVVRTRRAFEAVCDQIRQQIVRGELRPGDRLPAERELAEQFKISRSGVREALRNLESAGIAESRTGINGGFFIRSSTPEGITQVVSDMVSLGQVNTATVTEARIELTCLAIRMACARATPEELDAIGADIDFHADLFRQGRGSRNTRSVGEFYRLIARATHNDVIVMLLDALSEIVRTLLARIDPKPRADIVEVRRKVLRYMRAGDADRACAAMTVHLQHLNDYLEAERVARMARPADSARPPRPPVR